MPEPWEENRNIANVTRFGSTESGADWAKKALHPSKHEGDMLGMPDETSFPTLMFDYVWNVDIAAPAGMAADETWYLSMAQLPFAAGPVAFSSGITGEAASDWSMIGNPQLTGADITAKCEAISAVMERHRIVYQAITARFNAPALSNQGSVTAAMVAAKPVVLNFTSPGVATAGASVKAVAASHLLAYTSGDTPSLAKISGMHNQYTGLARDGLYMPMKLTTENQEWISSYDAYLTVPKAYAPSSLFNGSRYSIPQSDTFPTVSGWPFGASVNPVTQKLTPAGDGYTQFVGDPVFKFGSSMVGASYWTGLSSTSTITLTIRLGVQGQIYPGSTLTSLVKDPVVYDPRALEQYFAVVQNLPDAYPASFNDLNKLWSVINDIARYVAPGLVLVPKVGVPLSLGVGAAAEISDVIRKGIYDKEKKAVLNMKRKVAVTEKQLQKARKSMAKR